MEEYDPNKEVIKQFDTEYEAGEIANDNEVAIADAKNQIIETEALIKETSDLIIEVRAELEALEITDPGDTTYKEELLGYLKEYEEYIKRGYEDLEMLRAGILKLKIITQEIQEEEVASFHNKFTLPPAND